MRFSKHRLLSVLFLGASFVPVWGQPAAVLDIDHPEVAPLPVVEEEPVSAYRAAIQRLAPMDATGLDYGLSRVLQNYYRNNFTNAENWDQLESIRFEGTLHFPQGVVRFTAFKKKPDYCKVVILAGNGGRVVMAYDGQDAWQLNTLPGRAGASRTASDRALPEAMPEAEALNFIRDATTGGHLLYPLIKGKTITLEGTADVDGQRAYHLRIQLPDGQQSHSFLDMTTFAEIRQITTNNVNGDQEVTTHSDFRQIDGVRVPFTSTLTIDGQQVHQSRLYRVQADTGVMPWMFSRPSGAYIPGASPPLAGNAPSLPPSVSKPPQLPSVSPSESGQSGGIWAPSVFIAPDKLSAEEIESLSKQIGLPPVK